MMTSPVSTYLGPTMLTRGEWRIGQVSDTTNYFQSTMAATTQENQGKCVHHQELCGQLDQEMHQHHNLEGLPLDGGGIRQELLQRRQMKEMRDIIKTMREMPADGRLQCQEV